ncbi:MAG TPA: toll/interleukin-1 receptor domain-containing protein [Thermoanaerobaculia bacterium]|nr:toll/interleukin-1 receptor domain-containing protein [Thermoanaerobaculia bacterium]
MTRTFSWLRHAAGTAAAVLAGPVLVVAVFLAFQGFIPASVAPLLASLTVLLAGTLGLAVAVFRSRPAGLAALPRWLLGGAAVGLPVGLVLLVWSDTAFVRRVGVGVQRFEIVASPRPASCFSCQADWDDPMCLRVVGADPSAIERCWGETPVRRNRLLWSMAFLLSSGGVLSLVALVWCRSPAPRAVQADKAGEARHGLFLSHASEDGEFAERLARDLAGRGIPVWLDRWDIEVGESLLRRLEEGIAGSRWLGVVLSPDSITSPWVRVELDIALPLEIVGEGITVLPILLRPCEVPLALRHKRWADFTVSYATGLAGVLRSLGLAPRSDQVPPK